MLTARGYRELEAEVWTALPASLRRANTPSAWATANLRREVDSFLEGPAFAADGTLFVVDIPFGRVFAVSPQREWRVVAEYDGWPNGLKLDGDAHALVTDYRRGLLRIALANGEVETLLGHRDSESFRGLNDLTRGPDGALWFTDQGQSGLHDPCGSVYRWHEGRLERVLAHLPSPNGIVFDPSGHALYVAMTRDNAIWRAPLTASGTATKVGRFIALSGGTGPDGMTIDAQGRLYVAHIGLGCVWQFDRRGEALARIRTPGDWPTNVALSPDGGWLYITEAQRGEVLRWAVDAA